MNPNFHKKGLCFSLIGVELTHNNQCTQYELLSNTFYKKGILSAYEVTIFKCNSWETKINVLNLIKKDDRFITNHCKGELFFLTYRIVKTNLLKNNKLRNNENTKVYRGSIIPAEYGIICEYDSAS